MLAKNIRRFAGMVTAALLGIWLVGERGRLLLPSTRRMLASYGWRNVLNFKAIHGYIYGRWTRQYIYMGIRVATKSRLLRRLTQSWTDTYHGKVLTPELARNIITIEQDIPRQDLEQVIPYPTARSIVLNAPMEIAVYECVCRQARETPCEPTQVCMVIGQPFVDFIIEHHPQSARRLTQSEALQLLADEHARGHIHTAWFKDAMLDQFYAICNCCTCCCGGMENVQGGGRALSASGYIAEIDADLCAACGICESLCPFGAIQLNDAASVDWEPCMGCGVCVAACSSGAIALRRDAGKGIPLDVRALADIPHGK